MAAGLVDADLGGGLFKKRVARPGQGKSGGFRTLVATNRGDRWVFAFGFPKNERSNIDKDEEEALKKLATHLLSLTAEGRATYKQARKHWQAAQAEFEAGVGPAEAAALRQQLAAWSRKP